MLAGSIASVWYALNLKGYYLPHLSSSAITSEYLQKVMRGKVFRIEKKNIQKCTLLQKSSKVTLQLIKKTNYKILDSQKFTKQSVANLSPILYPMNQVFLKPKIEDVGLVAKRGFRITKIALYYSFLYQETGFRERTEEQRITITEKKSEQKLQHLKQKVDKKDLNVHSTQFASQYEKSFEKERKAKKDQRQT